MTSRRLIELTSWIDRRGPKPLHRIRERATFANVISLVALFVALGGSVYAAGKLNGKTIKKSSLPGNRLTPNSVTGKQVNESSLGTVPSSQSAATAGTANQAFSTFRDSVDPLPGATTTIATLNVPAGSYAVSAKLWVRNLVDTHVFCDLTAGGDSDRTEIGLESESPGVDEAAIPLQLVHTFASPGSVALACDPGTSGVAAEDIKITAIQVASLTNTPF